MRVLAAVTAIIFFYMIVQVFRAPTQLQGPGERTSAGKTQPLFHDPQLDRAFFVLFPLCKSSLRAKLHKQRPANLQSRCAESMASTTHPALVAHA